jgi:hypothetical protein
MYLVLSMARVKGKNVFPVQRMKHIEGVDV